MKKITGFLFVFTVMFMLNMNICAASDKSAEPVTGSALSVTEPVKLGIGQEYELIDDEYQDLCDVRCKSSDDSVVEVNDNGCIRGIAKGKANVTLSIDGNKAVYKVSVKNTGLPYPSYNIPKGETLRIRLNGNDRIVRWRTDNKKVATVKRGYIKALKKGDARIRAYTKTSVYSIDIKVTPAKKSVIYLTFDDGPSYSSTPKILNILKKNDVKATFFVINYDSAGEKLIKREAEEGHTIAIHGYSHDYGAIYTSEKAYMNNLYKLQDKLYKTLGYRTWLTRFPGGSSNLVSRKYNKGIMRKLVKTVDKNGYAYFDWNVSSGDAGGVHTSGQVYKNVVSGLRKNRDNVVLMHDFSGNAKTVNALNAIIKYGKSHGYEFRAITDSTAQVHHNVQN